MIGLFRRGLELFDQEGITVLWSKCVGYDYYALMVVASCLRSDPVWNVEDFSGLASKVFLGNFGE